MKSTSTDKTELSAEIAPTPNTPAELSEYIQSLLGKEIDYGMVIYVVSLTTTAAFNYTARQLGITGFQANCVALDVFRRIARMKGPFKILDGTQLAYPQDNILEQVVEWMANCQPWLQKECQRMLAEKDLESVSPHVIAHWQKLAGAEIMPANPSGTSPA